MLGLLCGVFELLDNLDCLSLKSGRCLILDLFKIFFQPANLLPEIGLGAVGFTLQDVLGLSQVFLCLIGEVFLGEFFSIVQFFPLLRSHLEADLR